MNIGSGRIVKDDDDDDDDDGSTGNRSDGTTHGVEVPEISLNLDDRDDDVRVRTGSHLDDSLENDRTSAVSSYQGDSKCHRYCIFRMKGLKKDWKYHISTYMDEWTRRPKSRSKVVAATVFAFCTQLIPALIFADVLDNMTNGSIGVIETLLSAGIIGTIYCVITGQSLVLLGITGPVAILLGTSYGLAETFDTNYYSFFFLICIWTSLLLILTSMNDTIMSFVTYITAFTSSIFEFFIGITFIYEALRELLQPLHLLALHASSSTTATSEEPQQDSESRTTTALAVWVSFVIGMLAFTICHALHFAENWLYFNAPFRAFLSSYTMFISMAIVTAFSYLPGIPNSSTTTGGIERVHVTAPWDGQPSDPTRSWVTNPSKGTSWKSIVGAFLPALMLYILFFIDHNISSILTQDPKFHLKKKPTYHWDILCLGVTIVPCAVLGLPPGSGLIPQAPLHTRALATIIQYEEDGFVKKVVTYVEEQRYSALGQALLMIVALGSFHAIALIPKAALYGIFLYLGVIALHDNDVFLRVSYMFLTENNRPTHQLFKDVKWATIQTFTIIEVICAFIIFGVANFASFGYVFPALVAALVPLRFYLLPRWYHPNDLKNLDPVVEVE